MKIICVSVLAVVMAVACAVADTPKVPAFPGAEGYGMYTVGGRGGRVIQVTSLDDSGTGTLREACLAEGPRIVVFNVGGIIDLKSPLDIENPYITIAGQTAPRDGICIRGQTVNINTYEVVIRYLRFRRGNLIDPDDALGGYPVRNIIVDHCSTSWGLDENFSLYRWMEETPDGRRIKRPVENLTIQWCISSEALNPYNHAFGATWGGRNASFHHNLFACNTGRNPSIGWCENVDYRNNVIFNWRHRTLDGVGPYSAINIIANYYKPGPACNDGPIRYRIARIEGRFTPDQQFERAGKWYVADNFVHGYPWVSRDNWDGGVQFHTESGGRSEMLDAIRADEPFDAAHVTTHSAQEAYQLVLERAGATLPKRDAVDDRVIEMVRTGVTGFGNGIINSPTDVGGWPKYSIMGKTPEDSDGDGMPDFWEVKYGFDPQDPSDGVLDADGDGYTNIEEYLNGTDPTEFIDYTDMNNNVNTVGVLYTL